MRCDGSSRHRATRSRYEMSASRATNKSGKQDVRRCAQSVTDEPFLNRLLPFVAAVEVVITILVEVTRVTANCFVPRGNVTGREQMPVVLGHHVAQLAPRLDERGIYSTAVPACRSPSVISRVTVSRSRGRGSSASGSKKIGSSGPGSRPNLSRKRSARRTCISRRCSSCGESAGHW